MSNEIILKLLLQPHTDEMITKALEYDYITSLKYIIGRGFKLNPKMKKLILNLKEDDPLIVEKIKILSRSELFSSEVLSKLINDVHLSFPNILDIVSNSTIGFNLSMFSESMDAMVPSSSNNKLIINYITRFRSSVLSSWFMDLIDKIDLSVLDEHEKKQIMELLERRFISNFHNNNNNTSSVRCFNLLRHFNYQFPFDINALEQNALNKIMSVMTNLNEITKEKIQLLTMNLGYLNKEKQQEIIEQLYSYIPNNEKLRWLEYLIDNVDLSYNIEKYIDRFNELITNKYGSYGNMEFRMFLSFISKYNHEKNIELTKTIIDYLLSIKYNNQYMLYAFNAKLLKNSLTTQEIGVLIFKTILDANRFSYRNSFIENKTHILFPANNPDVLYKNLGTILAYADEKNTKTSEIAYFYQLVNSIKHLPKNPVKRSTVSTNSGKIMERMFSKDICKNFASVMSLLNVESMSSRDRANLYTEFLSKNHQDIKQEINFENFEFE